MKLYTLTNKRSVQIGRPVVLRNKTQADIDALKACKLDTDNPDRSMLDLYDVQEFEVPERKSVTFVPDYLLKKPEPVKEETNGPSAGGDQHAQNG